MGFREIQWGAPGFEYREKDVSWYWLSIILAVLVLGLAVWQKNFLFGLFVVIAEVLILVWAHREPLPVRFTLTEKGLLIGGHSLYRYDTIAAFSVSEENDPHFANLVMHFRKKLRPPLLVKLPREKLEEVRNVLAALIPLKESEDSFLDTLERLVGF
ncbi:hypothetical protein C4571_02555 [Candidatus Parcubacteria bacterium]|nr:MAG: hypothetical protein C4571_02555 [Candidatus Parcubacteria bacterium]